MNSNAHRTSEDKHKRNESMEHQNTKETEADAKDTSNETPPRQGSDHPEEYTFKDWAQI